MRGGGQPGLCLTTPKGATGWDFHRLQPKSRPRDSAHPLRGIPRVPPPRQEKNCLWHFGFNVFVPIIWQVFGRKEIVWRFAPATGTNSTGWSCCQTLPPPSRVLNQGGSGTLPGFDIRGGGMDLVQQGGVPPPKPWRGPGAAFRSGAKRQTKKKLTLPNCVVGTIAATCSKHRRRFLDDPGVYPPHPRDAWEVLGGVWTPSPLTPHLIPLSCTKASSCLFLSAMAVDITSLLVSSLW